MKKVICFFMICLSVFPVKAALDDYVLSDKENVCKIHYLSHTPKKLWTIQTESTCPSGWIDGFAQVDIFDPFQQKTETLSGFFKQGYWLDQFVNLDSPVYRGNPQTDVQTLTFLTHQDLEIQTDYLALFKSVRPADRSYPAFSLCSKEAYFLVAHNKMEDFKNPVFQANIFKQIRIEAKSLCPKTNKLIVLGVPKADSDGSDWVLHADIDLQSGQTNLKYHAASSPQEYSEKPVELRREKSEKLVTIHPDSSGKIRLDYNNFDTKKIHTPPDNHKTHLSSWDYTDKNYSVLDLALLARIAPQPVLGKSVMHIDSIALDGTAFVNTPIPILLSATPGLKPGWAQVKGSFSVQDNILTVNPVTITSCQKEWCHEN